MNWVCVFWVELLQSWHQDIDLKTRIALNLPLAACAWICNYDYLTRWISCNRATMSIYKVLSTKLKRLKFCSKLLFHTAVCWGSFQTFCVCRLIIYLKAYKAFLLPSALLRLFCNVFLSYERGLKFPCQSWKNIGFNTQLLYFLKAGWMDYRNKISLIPLCLCLASFVSRTVHKSVWLCVTPATPHCVKTEADFMQLCTTVPSRFGILTAWVALKQHPAVCTGLKLHLLNWIAYWVGDIYW